MDSLDSAEQLEADDAYAYIKAHERELIEKFTSPKFYFPDAQAVSLFMAGSPGAGKTETSKRLAD